MTSPMRDKRKKCVEHRYDRCDLKDQCIAELTSYEGIEAMCCNRELIYCKCGKRKP